MHMQVKLRHQDSEITKFETQGYLQVR